MAFTIGNRKDLAGRILIDRDFRSKLLANPTEALKALDIDDLDDEEIAKIAAAVQHQSQRIRSIAEKVDKDLDDNQQIEAFLILISHQDGGDDDEDIIP